MVFDNGFGSQLVQSQPAYKISHKYWFTNFKILRMFISSISYCLGAIRYIAPAIKIHICFHVL